MNKTLLIALALIPSSVFAEGTTPVTTPAAASDPAERGVIAVLVGPSFILTGNGGSHFTYGGRASFVVGQDSRSKGSLGVAINTMSNTATAGPATVEAHITFIALEYVAREAWGSGLYFGARAGAGLNNGTLRIGSTAIGLSDTVFAFAPVVGWEARLSKTALLMVDTAWNNIGGGTFMIGSTPVAYDRTAAFTLSAGLGFSF